MEPLQGAPDAAERHGADFEKPKANVYRPDRQRRKAKTGEASFGGANSYGVNSQWQLAITGHD